MNWHRLNQTPGLLTIFLLLLPVCVAARGEVESVSGADENTVELQVYKKWIGASGDEADVEIRLSCPQQMDFQPKFINRDQPGGWEIDHVPSDGLFCSVREIERDTFIADYGDCLDLLVIPGQEAECTIVNTKVVKRIDMLNRYGLVMMIAVMLGAGLAAVRRFTPP
ncbi:MAG TPA: hypothetical protein VI566_01845 [Xanthomonadales bacterium]|nr:hypothetical protein [Xanthomonadales bacterium]